MPKVSIRKLQTGQILIRDAITPHGRLLLKAGVVIEERHLEMLRTWGIVEVEVAGDEDDSLGADIDFSALPLEAKEQIKRYMMRQFSHCDVHHPMMKELILYQRTRLTRRYLNGEVIAP